MYTSIPGAKKRATSLHTALQGSGFVISHGHCLEAMARAGGYASWHELNQVAAPDATGDPVAARRRLLGALPKPCHAAARAWLNREPSPPETGVPDMPPRWYPDVSPYWMASMGLHRRSTPLVRRGSGPGQRLREELVIGLLVNQHGGPSPTPWLEPQSLALVYRGDLRTLYRATMEHPKFEIEFANLVKAGVLEWRPDGRNGPSLWVSAPEGLQAAVEEGAVGMALHWIEGDPESDEGEIRLTQALAVLGVDRPADVASALLRRNADAYVGPSGEMLSVLSELAAAGSLRSFALGYDLFVRMRPETRNHVRASLPAKIVSQYLPSLGHSAGVLHRWTTAHPDWAETLKVAADAPETLIREVRAMEASLSNAEPVAA